MERALTEELKARTSHRRTFTHVRDGANDERRQSVHDYSKGEKPTAPPEQSNDQNLIRVNLNCADSDDEDDDIIKVQSVKMIDILIPI